MTGYEIVTICLSFTSLSIAGLLGYVSFNNSKELKEIEKRNEIREEQNLKLNMAQTELYIQEMLVNSRKLFLDINLEKLKLILNENEEANKISELLLTNTLQEILNSYEIACMKFLDDKIDRERFKKTYIKEITDLFSAEQYNDLLGNANTYQAIKKVNGIWNNHENT